MESTINYKELEKILNSKYIFKYVINHLSDKILIQLEEKYLTDYHKEKFIRNSIDKYDKSKEQAIRSLIDKLLQDTNSQEKLVRVCEDLKISCKLPFNQFRHEIIHNLSIPGSFLNTITALQQNEFITISDSEKFLEHYEKDPKKSVENLLNYLEKKPCVVVQDIHVAFNDIINSWSLFIQNVKEHIRNQYEFVELPAFIDGKMVRMNDIITPVEIVHLRNTSLLSRMSGECFETYQNFYNIFLKKFKKVLIQGEPGSGKTIQFRYLLYTWSNKIYDANDNILLIGITLRDVAPDQDLYKIIYQQNFRKISYMNKNIVQSIIEERKDQIFLLIDGADEFNNPNHLLEDILVANECPVPVVIWSRNWRAEKIMDTCDIIFELVGFNDEQLKLFLKKCINNQESIEYFMENFNKQTFYIKNISRIPILALSIYALYEKNKSILNLSVYEIYEKILELINPQTKPPEKLLNKFRKLCFKNIEKQMILLDITEMDEEHLRKSFGGIIQIIPVINSNQNVKKIQFYHLSYMEFFAAQYLCKKFGVKLLSKLKRKNLFENCSSKSIWNTLKFVREKSENVFLYLLKDKYIRLNFYYEEASKRTKPKIGKCDHILLEVISLELDTFYIFGMLQNSFQMFTKLEEFTIGMNSKIGCDLCKIIDWLENSKSTITKLDFSNCMLEISDDKRLNKSLQLFTKLEQFAIKISSYYGEDLCEIIDGFVNCKSAIKILNFSNCDFFISDDKRLQNSLQLFTELEQFVITNSLLYNKDLCEIIDGFVNCKSVIRILDFSNCTLCISDEKRLQNSLQLFTNLEELTIGIYSDYRNDLCEIIDGLVNSKSTITKLDFSNCRLEISDDKRLKKSLQLFIELKHVTIKISSVCGQDFCKIIDGFFNCKSSIRK